VNVFVGYGLAKRARSALGRRYRLLAGAGAAHGVTGARTRVHRHEVMQSRAVFAVSLMVAFTGVAAGEPLKRNPTPQDYIERNGGGATVVPAGRLVLGGHRVSCGHWPTVLDPNLNDYAASSYPQFIILNMRYVAKVPTAVKLWIYNHECGHKFGGPDENKADCFAVRRGSSAGWLTPHGLDQVCSFISAARPDRWHLAGPERCALMRECSEKSMQAKPPQ
jgi:hypothetical protein